MSLVGKCGKLAPLALPHFLQPTRSKGVLGGAFVQGNPDFFIQINSTNTSTSVLLLSIYLYLLSVCLYYDDIKYTVMI